MTQDEKIKELIQELLQDLNRMGKVHGPQYGLPLDTAEVNAMMSERVYKWVINIIVNADKKEYTIKKASK